MNIKLNKINKILPILILVSVLISACTGSKNKSENNSLAHSSSLKKQNIKQDIGINNLKASKWNIVGNSNFSQGAVENEKMVISLDGTRYIAVRDLSTNPRGQVTVMYNNDDRKPWQILGKAGLN
jgi:hypothetical protein